MLTFLILLIPFQIIPQWSGILVSWPTLKHLDNEFIHVLLNPRCVYLRVYILCFRGQDALQFSPIQQWELLNTLTWRKIATGYFKNQELAMIFPCALHPEGSLESPEPHQPQPNTPSTSVHTFTWSMKPGYNKHVVKNLG